MLQFVLFYFFTICLYVGSEFINVLIAQCDIYIKKDRERERNKERERGRESSNLLFKVMESTRHFETLVRAIRSTGPRELLLKLAVNREELQKQLHAVILQAAYRGYCGRRKAKLLRRRLAIFQRVTEQVADIIMEQFILQTSLDLAINFHKVNSRYHRLRQEVEEGIVAEMESIVIEVVNEEVNKGTEELLLSAADSLVAIRRRQQLQRQIEATRTYRDYLSESQNPLITTLVVLLVEECREVVIEVVLAEAEAHMLIAHSQRIGPQLVDEFIRIEILRLLLDEFAMVEETGMLSKALQLIEESEAAQIVLCDRSVRSLQRERRRLAAALHPRSSSPEQRIKQATVELEEDARSSTAAQVVSQNVSKAILQRLLKSHEARYDESPILSLPIRRSTEIATLGRKFSLSAKLTPSLSFPEDNTIVER